VTLDIMSQEQQQMPTEFKITIDKHDQQVAYSSWIRNKTQSWIERYGMRYFTILIFSLFVPVTSAQPQSCAALPTKTAVPAGNTAQSPNQTAMIAALNSPDLAAKKLQFQQQMAKLDSDPTVQAQRTKHQQLLSAAVNSPDFQKLKLQMANQVAAAQNSASFLNQKALFLANLKCTAP
jgi:flagellar basal body rod protein FlgB